jgi:single-strand DNA-binding protein
VYVEGSLRTRKWTDKDGVERFTTEIRADEMKMLGKREGMGGPGGGDDDGGYDSAPRSRAPAPQRSAPAGGGGGAARPAASKPASGFDDMDDDIPF